MVLNNYLCNNIIYYTTIAQINHKLYKLFNCYLKVVHDDMT